MEFHISRSLREQLDLDEVLFSYAGNVVFANVAASRKLAQGLNDLRGHAGDAAEGVNAGALFAMGLIDELNHAMVDRYRENIDPKVLTEAVKWFEQRLGKTEVDRLLLAFTERFPGMSVYRGDVTAAAWLKGTTEGFPNREAALEELLMLWLANINPAFKQFRELFEDDALQQTTAYPTLTAGLPDYFSTRPPVSKEVGNLIEALRAPMLASPDSLVGQLEFIRERWAPYLGKDLRRVLLAIDVVREEDVAIWMRFHPPAPGRFEGEPGWEAHGFVGDEYVGFDEDFVVGADGIRRPRQYSADHQAPLVEYEAFSQDQAWMPTVVMMAKSTYVWLEQLSKKYLRHIHRLDQIPDEELQLLADRGMTALWLIGLWERSVASKTIKRLRGQADAVASAYSLKEYQIADDLGGNEAYERLRDRAGAYGLRLASDMVPNHMGIDSSWVIEHPEWFINRSDSPFPVYRFDGPDLSTDSRAEIKIEDHYYDQTDAAVAFKLHTYGDNATRFVYHGNDGTTFAWNDTAQLDYSKASVREHVIQVILHVARLFPIIRFDAAMVLAKRHVQRLWFPLPGVGGSIPSRAEYAMSQEEFDALMPNEFWREVVDRVTVEVPGTLLLAEAFWLLEGYFVRTLGMHRVYNSAFMNMLRDEENAKYRSYLKKTVEFDPDILKRYVNFMSNPDERTAADQFGSGDKYFGTCTLLATLPGLPMFAHGQIEGFTERYGMDFKEARLLETPDEELISRYQHEITPLLRNRWLFAESTHFVLYDFWNEHGSVDENVIAYSNRSGDARAIILYNNVYGSTRGTIHISAASVDKGSGILRQRSLSDALALPHDNDGFVAYRDTTVGLEYLRRASELRDQGLTMDLRGYQYVVLQQWRELRASWDKPWDKLCDALRGTGVQNLDEALSTLQLRPVHEALRRIVSAANLQIFAEEPKRASEPVEARPRVIDEVSATDAEDDTATEEFRENAPAEKIDEHLVGFVGACRDFQSIALEYFGVEKILPSLSDSEDLELPETDLSPEEKLQNLTTSALQLRFLDRAPISNRLLRNSGELQKRQWVPVLVWIALAGLPDDIDKAELFDRLRLRNALGDIFSALGMTGDENWRAAARVRVLLMEYGAPAEAIRSEKFWTDPDVRWLTGVSEAYGTIFFAKEKFEELLSWMQLPSLISTVAEKNVEAKSWPEMQKALARIYKSAEKSGYKLDEFRGLLSGKNGKLAALAEANPVAPVVASGVVEKEETKSGL